MKIKVCGNIDLNNLLEVLALSPDMLGFIFYKHSKRYIGGDTALMRVIASLKSIKKIGVFVNAEEDEIHATTDAYRLDAVQLHGNESPEFCKNISSNTPVIKAFGICNAFNFEIVDAYKDVSSYFLFDTATIQYGGSGETFDWSLLDQYNGNTPFLLSGGIDATHRAAIKSISHPAFAGIDVNSKFEISPGIKNTSNLKTFIHEIRN